MRDIGIYPGDILIINRSITAKAGDIVMCVINGDTTVKVLEHQGGSWRLAARNPDYPDILVKEFDDIVIWGVVTGLARKFC